MSECSLCEDKFETESELKKHKDDTNLVDSESQTNDDYWIAQ